MIKESGQSFGVSNDLHKLAQISSVTNGKNGCNNLRVCSNTYAKIDNGDSASWVFSLSFVNSMYQSQYSFQRKS